jgi:hypothetical protein
LRGVFIAVTAAIELNTLSHYPLDTMTDRLMWAALQAKPRSYEAIIVG